MPRIVNVGSINIDHVYRVDEFVQPGATIPCRSYDRFAGGKGLNQSIALVRAGASTFHVGAIGAADLWLRDLLREQGVDTRYVTSVDGPSGHAVIQVNAAGENAIVIHGGANRRITAAGVEAALAEFDPQDFVLLQNEVSAVPDIIRLAKRRGLRVACNPAPMTENVAAYPLELVDLLVVNETEAESLTGAQAPEVILDRLFERWPDTRMVLTLGRRGAFYQDGTDRRFRAAEEVAAVDTTAAGDTFTGFFLAEWMRNQDPTSALSLASRAAALCVTRPGAAESIPRIEELA